LRGSEGERHKQNMEIKKMSKRSETKGFIEVSQILDDILNHLGIIIVAEAGHGKSYTAFTLVKEAMKRKDVTVIVFSPSTVWRRKFGAINCVKVGTSGFNPIQPIEKTEVQKTPFLRDTVWINLDKKWSFHMSTWLKALLDSQQHLLFEIKYKNGRRIKHFESQVLQYLYAKQERYLDVAPYYNHHYIIVFEELQNAFGTYSMNTDNSLELFTVFTQSRSDALIHYIGIGQRLNDISTKICERLRPLVGLTVGENSLRKIRAMLPKHLKQKVQQLPQRTWIYLNGKTNPIIEMPIYHKEGKPFFLKPKPILEAPQPKPKPKQPILDRILGRIFNWKTTPQPKPQPKPRETTEIEEAKEDTYEDDEEATYADDSALLEDEDTLW